MKKIFCLCLAIVLCLAVWGCQKEDPTHTPSDPTGDTSDPAGDTVDPSDEMETVRVDDLDGYIYGLVTDKISANY